MDLSLYILKKWHLLNTYSERRQWNDGMKNAADDLVLLCGSTLIKQFEEKNNLSDCLFFLAQSYFILHRCHYPPLTSESSHISIVIKKAYYPFSSDQVLKPYLVPESCWWRILFLGAILFLIFFYNKQY